MAAANKVSLNFSDASEVGLREFIAQQQGDNFSQVMQTFNSESAWILIY